MAVMKGVRFDMLTLMHTMHGIGLMPTDIYETERDRLVELISRQQDWTASPLNIEQWKDAATNKKVDMERVRFTLTDEVDESEASPDFDWRVMVADYLEAAFDVDQDTAEKELDHLGVQPTYRENRSGFSHYHGQIEFLRRVAFKFQADSDNLRKEFHTEIGMLRAEIRRLSDG